MDAFQYLEREKVHDSEGLKYFGPIDSNELERLSLVHRVFEKSWRGNFSAPVEDILRSGGAYVLDVGCGPAAWMLAMAREYFAATFIGIDIITISLQELKPENVGFLPFDITHGIPFPNDTFDYTFQRFILMSFAENFWITEIGEIVRVTKPEGWIELMEIDVEFYNIGPIMKRFRDATQTLSKSKGLNGTVTPKLVQLMRESPNLIDFTVNEAKTYFGSWAGKQGKDALKILEDSWRGLASVLSTVMNIDEKEYDQMISDLGNEANKYKSYYISYRMIARKILTPEPELDPRDF
ncbi:hypothetical protein G9A89_007027 [Geosiphon pyriformis]|nr:hypothetical protein G9A89_007027 [Geosiphon pyriformis]